MSLVGTCVYFTILIIIPFVVTMYLFEVQIGSLADNLNAYANFMTFFGIVGVIDFLTMGYLRRFKVIAFIYWPIYRFFSFLTLSKYYRHIYYAIVTNLNRWWLFLFFFLFTFFSLLGTGSLQFGNSVSSFSRIEIWSSQDGNQAFEGHYQDKSSTAPSAQVQIPSDIIRDDVLRVFIPSRINRQDSLTQIIH